RLSSCERGVLPSTLGAGREPPTSHPRGSHALSGLAPAIAGGSLLLLGKSVKNSSEFVRVQPWILLINVVSVIALSILLARKIWQLVREYREHIPGSRLTARTVTTFGVLVVAPLLIVYLFSLEFLNRGIDSWFRVEIKQGLSNALSLSRDALDLRMREYSNSTQQLARALVNAGPGEIQQRLDQQRASLGAREIALFGDHEGILAASLENPLETLPTRPQSDLLRQIAQLRPYVSLEPQADGNYLI